MAATDEDKPEQDTTVETTDDSPTAEVQQRSETSKRSGPPQEAVKEPRRISISLRSAVSALIIGILVAAVGVLGWLYTSTQSKLDEQNREAANRTKAEELATDYAVNAAQMDYKDFAAWKVNLVKGTSPELNEKLTKAADSMEQVLAPLQWRSTARPLAAKVRSSAGGIYTVDSFVSVLTKTLQAPEGLQSTATYSVTLDSRNNWQITDVGGIDSALGK